MTKDLIQNFLTLIEKGSNILIEKEELDKLLKIYDLKFETNKNDVLYSGQFFMITTILQEGYGSGLRIMGTIGKSIILEPNASTKAGYEHLEKIRKFGLEFFLRETDKIKELN